MTETGAVASLILVRHGETLPNRARVRCGGDRDPPLTETGRGQMARCAAALAAAGVRPSHLLTAPLDRTRASAAILAARLGCPVTEESGLVERFLGAWNGQPIAATEADLRAGVTPPGGESESDFRARVRSTLARLLARSEPMLLLVTSKGVIRVALMELAGVAIPPVGNAAPLRLDRLAPEQWVLRAREPSGGP